MNPEQLGDLVRYRLEQASETLADAGRFVAAIAVYLAPQV